MLPVKGRGLQFVKQDSERDNRLFGKNGRLLDYSRRYYLTIDKEYATRSLDQNEYYWAVVVEAIAIGIDSDNTEKTKDKWHGKMKVIFLAKPKGQTIRKRCHDMHRLGISQKEIEDYAKQQWQLPADKFEWETYSTTELNTVEFEIFLEKVRRWAVVEHSIYIPLPNEVGY